MSSLHIPYLFDQKPQLLNISTSRSGTLELESGSKMREACIYWEGDAFTQSGKLNNDSATIDFWARPSQLYKARYFLEPLAGSRLLEQLHSVPY